MPQATQTFAAVNVDDADETRPTSHFTAGVNLALEPGYVTAQRGNVLVSYALPQAGTTTAQQVGIERLYFVQHTYVYHSNTTGPDVTNTVVIGYLLLSGTAGVTGSTYAATAFNTPLNRYDADLTGPALTFAAAYGHTTGPALAGYTLDPNASSSAVAFNDNYLVQRTFLVTHLGGRTRGLGGWADGTTGGAVLLYWNEFGDHRIVRYLDGVLTTVLEWSGLNLSETLVLDGGLDDEVLVYRDADGELRGVNLRRAANGEYTRQLLLQQPYALHLVKPGPVLPPSVQRVALSGTAQPAVAAQAVQAAIQYRYPDGEVSVLSPYSRILFPLDPTDPPYGAVRINWPAPPIAVAETLVCVRRDTETVWQVVATIPSLPVGSPPPSFDYTGSVTGEVIPARFNSLSSEALWPCETALIAHNRVIAGNFEEGYPVPAIAATITTGAYTAATDPYVVTAGIYSRTVSTGSGNVVRYFVELVPSFTAGTGTYARVTLQQGVYVRVDGTEYTFNQAFVAYGSGESSAGLPNNGAGTVGAQPYADSSTAAGLRRTWHERETMGVALVFRDALGRTGGASPEVAVTIPAQTYANPTAKEIRWALNPSLAALIPLWATTYQFVVSAPRRTGYYRQTRASGDTTQPTTPTGGLPAASSLRYGLVNIQPLTEYGLGYQWTKDSGDRIRFVDSGGDVAIAGQSGNYLTFALGNGTQLIAMGLDPNAVGTSYELTDLPRMEIYSPVTTVATDNPLYYEVGPAYPIVRTGSATSFSTLSGVLYGNHWLVRRPRFAALDRNGSAQTYGPVLDSSANQVLDWYESTSPSQTAPGLWLDVDRARVTAAVPKALQQVRRQHLLRFSGVRVEGTRINGFSQWDPLNQYEELPSEQGAIVKLSIADQTQTDGSILLVNQAEGAASVALSRGQIQTADGTELLTITKQVIGGSNSLRGGYGCTAPASVTPYAGKVFFWCARRAELLRYDRNGLTPLGEVYHFRQRLQALGRQYAGGTVRGCYDPRRKEYWLTFLPIGDEPGETVGYSDRREAWFDQLTALPEAGLAVGNELLTWQDGGLWRHTPDAPQGSFFGTYTAPQLAFAAANPGGLLAKIWQAIGIHSTSRWVPTQLITTTGQASRIFPNWLNFINGVWRAAIRRDELSPGPGAATYKLHNGRVLQSVSLRVTLTAPAEATPLTSATVDFLVKTGQQPNQ